MKYTMIAPAIVLIALCLSSVSHGDTGDDRMNQQPDEQKSIKASAIDNTKPQHALVFATYAASEEELAHVRYLAESIRAFAGKHSDSPVWAYVPVEFAGDARKYLEDAPELGIEIKTSNTPEDARWFYYSGKTFAAGLAEAEAEKVSAVLVWMDEDTIVLQEPVDLVLGEGTGFAYRPVMHNRSGSLYSEPPDSFWARIYEKLSLDTDSLFSMVTPADRQTIRAYFNAGLLVVRPEHEILRKWGESFKVLYRDSVLANMCKEDVTKRIFLHQTALVGAVMHTLGRDSMIELSDGYNYPMFFKRMFGANEEFDSLDDVFTLRYDFYFRDPDPNWSEQLKGPENVISWMKDRLGK